MPPKSWHDHNMRPMSTSDAPRVSVVIPTRHRPKLVSRAIASVLAQTLEDLEVVVVSAAPDSATTAAIAGIEDERVRHLDSGESLNASAARNRGVTASRGSWTAFLDDDDTWEPDKLTIQLAAAEASAWKVPVISCSLVARCAQGDLIFPRRLPGAGEPVADYLFRRRGLLGGGGMLQSSTLFAPRSLLLSHPFNEQLARAEDLDWAIRVDRLDGCGFEFAGKTPLVVWDIEDDRPRASSDGHWEEYVSWIADLRGIVSPEAYSGYLLTWASNEAARQGAGWRGFSSLWRRAWTEGSPSLLDAVVHAGHFLVPQSLRRTIGALQTRSSRRGAAHDG